ncbi:hypothetical protein DMH17_01930 [Raoultella planticola]|nr:hypothetical protein [Raoultella planticola]
MVNLQPAPAIRSHDGHNLYHPTFDTAYWIAELEKQLPGRAYVNGSPAILSMRTMRWSGIRRWKCCRAGLKSRFALGAGVDSILSKLREHPEMLPMSIPLFRLEDTGMGQQMQEYAVSQVLHWFRRFDDYRALKQQSAGSRWRTIVAKSLPSG